MQEQNTINYILRCNVNGNVAMKQTEKYSRCGDLCTEENACDNVGTGQQWSFGITVRQWMDIIPEHRDGTYLNCMGSIMSCLLFKAMMIYRSLQISEYCLSQCVDNIWRTWTDQLY